MGRSGLELRHYLPADAQGLCVSVRGDRLVQPLRAAIEDFHDAGYDVLFRGSRACAVAADERIEVKTGKLTREVSYGLTSLTPCAADAATLERL